MTKDKEQVLVRTVSKMRVKRNKTDFGNESVKIYDSFWKESVKRYINNFVKESAEGQRTAFGKRVQKGKELMVDKSLSRNTGQFLEKSFKEYRTAIG